MSASATLEIRSFIDERRMSRRQWILTVLCFIGIGWFIIAPIFGVNLGNTASGM